MTDEPTTTSEVFFPTTLQGGASRCFHSEWYKDHPWLEHSQTKDAAYCFAIHSTFLNAPKSVYPSDGRYCNWKMATFKDSGFNVKRFSEGP